MYRIKEMKDTVKKYMITSEIYGAMAHIANYDPALLLHCNGVAVISGLMAQELGLPSGTVADIIKGAMVHDFGKTFLDKELLNKVGPLTETELNFIRDHSRLGFEYLKDVTGINDTILDIVLHHHETETGTGYPDGCTQMRLETKIVTMADTYNAISSYRVYRQQEMNRLSIVRQMELLSKKFSDGEKLLDVLLNVAFSERI